MPQYPLVPPQGGTFNVLDISVPTVIKATPGRVWRVVVLTAASAGTFGVYDCATTGAAATANAVFQEASAWPAAGTVLTLEWPCEVGIVVNPGTSGVVSVSYA